METKEVGFGTWITVSFGFNLINFFPSVFVEIYCPSSVERRYPWSNLASAICFPEIAYKMVDSETREITWPVEISQLQ